MTDHLVLHEVHQREEDRNKTYAMLECAGCHTISLGIQTTHFPNGEVEHTYYPPPVSRDLPTWAMFMALGFTGTEEETIGTLLREIHQAVRGRLNRLAAMGIRSLLEQLMISKVGDKKRFDKNLEAFKEQGWISLVQYDAVKTLLDVGHATTHRFFEPTTQELNLALDIVEGVLAAIYQHHEAAARLGDRVPPRSTPSKP
jgi:hypothetical protein